MMILEIIESGDFIALDADQFEDDHLLKKEDIYENLSLLHVTAEMSRYCIFKAKL